MFTLALSSNVEDGNRNHKPQPMETWKIEIIKPILKRWKSKEIDVISDISYGFEEPV